MTPIPASLRALLAAFLLGSPLLAQTGFIQGTVMTEGGAPLPGMVVAAYNGAGELATTNVTATNGAYLLSLPSATYRVLAYDLQGAWATSYYNDAGSFETSATIDVAAGSSRSGIDFRLRPGMRIHGMVKSSTGAPLAGMTVSAYNADGTRRGHQTSGDDGTYVLVVPAGQYKMAAWDDVRVFAPEFYAEARSYSTASTITAASNVFGIDFSLDLGARVDGTVSAEGTRQPLGGIDVSAYELITGEQITHTATRADGGFQFALPVGRYKFVAADPEGKYATEFYANAASFEAAASFDLEAGSWRTGVDFTLAEKTEPPAPSTLFIPGVINSPGGGGSYWRTDVWIYNPTQETLTVTATYFAGTAAGIDTTIVISPRGQVEIANIVESLFATSGLGSLRLRAALPFAAVSRTFNTPPNATEGTFGFSIAGMDVNATLGLAVLPGVAQSAAYRTNVGIMNPHDHSVTITARLYSSSGALLGETPVPLDPFTVQQPALTTLFGAAIQVTGGYVILSSDGGSFFSYASVVDNKSNDPTLVLPTADRP